jgi:ribulose-phosphate 3-epimerase
MTVNPGALGQKLVPATLKKIADVRCLLDNSGHEHVEIQAMAAAGATMRVGGTSSVFHKDDSIGDAIAAVRSIVNQTERVP